MNSINQRNSSLELLKIIAIILIVMSHILPYWIENSIGLVDLTTSTNNVIY